MFLTNIIVNYFDGLNKPSKKKLSILRVKEQVLQYLHFIYKCKNT